MCPPSGEQPHVRPRSGAREGGRDLWPRVQAAQGQGAQRLRALLQSMRAWSRGPRRRAVRTGQANSPVRTDADEYPPRSGQVGTAKRGEAGMVTAELALSLSAVVLVLALLLTVAAAGLTQLRVADGARAAARQAALGSGDVAGAAIRVAGPASVGVERGELVCVTVSRPVGGPLGGLGWRANARACAYVEPGTA